MDARAQDDSAQREDQNQGKEEQEHKAFFPVSKPRRPSHNKKNDGTGEADQSADVQEPKRRPENNLLRPLTLRRLLQSVVVLAVLLRQVGRFLSPDRKGAG